MLTKRMSARAKESAVKVLRFMRARAVMCISAVAAFATMAFVPPDAEYLSYFDIKTLVCLFCILSTVGAIRNAGAFERAADAIVSKVSHPLAAAALIRGRWLHLLPVTFVLQGLAANLCGMIVPFGNPQNLYLFSYYDLSLDEFVATMALPFGVSVALLVVSVLIIARPGASSTSGAAAKIDDAGRVCPWRIAVLIALLVVIVLSVFNIVSFWMALAIVVVALLLLDRPALIHADYALLLTFAFFFIFAGNMARIPAVQDLLSGLMQAWALPLSAGLSQIISNVPAAVLLSHFTSDWASVLIGVNIGGAGTLVGSLANLIVLERFTVISRLYSASEQQRKMLSTKRFIAVFSVFNFAYLAILFSVCWFSR